MNKPLDNRDAQGATAHPVASTGRITLKKSEVADMRKALGVEAGEAFDLIATQEVLRRKNTNSASTGKAFGCLLMFTPEQWNAFKSEVESLPLLDPQAAEMRRLYLGGECKISVDKQDRLKLSSDLMDWAGLVGGKTHATLLFTGAWWELWETNAYDEHMRESAAEIEAYKSRKWGDAAAASDEDAER